MLNICAPLLENSGYGEFSRSFVTALAEQNEEFSVENVQLNTNSIPTDHGEAGKIVKVKLREKSAHNPTHNLIFSIAPLFARSSKRNCKNIGFTMWEADRYPPSWVSACNQMDAIFTPSSWGEKILKESGVTVPVGVVSPSVTIPPTKETRATNAPFVFLSVFQWTERKNPLALFKAYFSAFSSQDNVVLRVKTYRAANAPNFEAEGREFLAKLKAELKLPEGDYPKVEFVSGFLTKKDMGKLYDASDCYVSTHRAEGWGMPIMEAMAHGLPVIATEYSAPLEFLSKQNSTLIPYQMTPCIGMGTYVPWMNGSMWWADIDVKTLSLKMRAAQQGEMSALGAAGQKTVADRFSSAVCAQKITSALGAL